MQYKTQSRTELKRMELESTAYHGMAKACCIMLTCISHIVLYYIMLYYALLHCSICLFYLIILSCIIECAFLSTYIYRLILYLSSASNAKGPHLPTPPKSPVTCRAWLIPAASRVQALEAQGPQQGLKQGSVGLCAYVDARLFSQICMDAWHEKKVYVYIYTSISMYVSMHV